MTWRLHQLAWIAPSLSHLAAIADKTVKRTLTGSCGRLSATAIRSRKGNLRSRPAPTFDERFLIKGIGPSSRGQVAAASVPETGTQDKGATRETHCVLCRSGGGGHGRAVGAAGGSRGSGTDPDVPAAMTLTNVSLTSPARA